MLALLALLLTVSPAQANSIECTGNYLTRNGDETFVNRPYLIAFEGNTKGYLPFTAKQLNQELADNLCSLCGWGETSTDATISDKRLTDGDMTALLNEHGKLIGIGSMPGFHQIVVLSCKK